MALPHPRAGTIVGVETEVTCTVADASDKDTSDEGPPPWRQYDDTFNKDNAYTWSAKRSGSPIGSFKDGDNTGQTVTWIAASQGADVTITVTLDDPACATDFRTVLYLATEGSSATTESACVTDTWANFSGSVVCKWTSNQAGYTTELHYYDGNTGITSAAGLLSTGNGQCGAWADLLRECFLANNVPNVAFTLVRPPIDYNRFAVKNITFDDADPTYDQYAPWQYKENSRTDDLDVTVNGEPGQNTNPPYHKLFALHYIVHVGAGDDYYDPSYGITTTGPTTYTTTAVDAWRMLYEDPPHADNQWRKRTGDPSVLRFDDF